MTVESMVEAGSLERVAPDVDGAALALEEATRHASSAEQIATSDPNGAYQLAYDAARKAVMAKLRQQGLRVRKGEGGHALTADFARVAIDEELGKRLESMRRRRNRSEYGSAYFSADEVGEAIEVARGLIAASA